MNNVIWSTTDNLAKLFQGNDCGYNHNAIKSKWGKRHGKILFSNEAIERAKRAIKRLAKDHGVPEEEVRNEIKEAMLSGMMNPDPAVRAQWAAIRWRNGKPTVDEFVAYITEQVEAQAEQMKSQ